MVFTQLFEVVLVNAENALSFRLLGELRVKHAGVRLELPPSRKTRALLAYLLVTGREHRRERLCSLFWDVADDPRGALRWSLSKLRALVDQPDQRRIVATREQVVLQTSGAAVDLHGLRAALPGRKNVEAAPSALLEHWAGAYSGELMEGLDLPDFHEFQAWLVAEREQTRRLHAAIVQTLAERLATDPERALPHARTWAKVDPLDPNAHATLLRISLSAGLRGEAEQHYASAIRTFQELDSQDSAAITATWNTLKRTPAKSDPTVHHTASSQSLDRTQTPSTGSFVAAPPCIGRDQERADLRKHLNHVTRDRATAVLSIGGEPGVGKTRLLDDFLEHARAVGATVLRGAAFEAERDRPYGPFVDGLKALSSPQERNEAPNLAPPIFEWAGQGDREGGRGRLFSAVSDLVATRAQQQPVVLALDDVQWLDAASAELLHFLVRTSRRLPMLVALTVRSEEAADNTALVRVLRSLRRDRVLTEWSLSPLSPEAVERLVRTTVDGVDPGPVIAQAGGNPLFALELARVGRNATDGHESSLPSSVADAVRERLERLSAEPADVLRWGAVLGRNFRLERIEELVALDIEAVVTALEELERSSLLIQHARQDGQQEYGFAHEVVKRVVYADLSEPRRRLMHRRVASTLRKRDDLGETLVAEIAHHATLGHDDDLAASACVAAARRCLRLYASAEALTLSRRGLYHADRLTGLDRTKRTIELMETLQRSARSEDPKAAAALLQQLGERALSEGAVEHARMAFHTRSYLNWEGGAWEAAERDTLQAMSVSREAGEPQHVTAMAEAARCLALLERDLVKADALMTEAHARARPLGIETAVMHDGQGMLAAHQGRYEEAVAHFEQAKALAKTAADRFLEYYAVEHLTTLELDREAFTRAHAHCPALIALGDRMREGSEGPFARAVEALVRCGLGQSADEDLSTELQMLRDLDAKYRLTYVLTRVALIDVTRGDAKRALSRIAEAMPHAELLQRPSEVLLGHMIALRAAEDLGDHEASQRARRAISKGRWRAVAASVRALVPQLLGAPLAEGTGREPLDTGTPEEERWPL